MKKIILLVLLLASLLYLFIQAPENSFYKPGLGLEKEATSPYKIMTLNACMLDNGLQKKYGGMIEPKARIQRFAGVISEQNPDIYLGQELTAISGNLLYDELKNEYPHFWIGMGIKPGDSGLFVASKFPIISEPRFYPFPSSMQIPKDIRVMERGFFCLETPSYWIITSHMEGGSPEKVGGFRKEQLKYITDKADKLTKGKTYILAGDLNIIRLNEPGDEYSTSGISEYYYDYYTEHHPEFSADTVTNTNLFTADANNVPRPTAESDKNEIDDYFLIRKPFQDQFKNLQVDLITTTYDLNKPYTEAITDHRAYVAQFSID